MEIFPEEGVACSDFTQSLMELGALICKPQTPDCRLCPLQGICRAFAHKTQENYPVIPKKKEKKTENLCVFLIETPNGFAIRKRENSVLKGMNEFPSFPKNSLKECLKEIGVTEFSLIKQGNFKHIFTHIVWKMDVYYVKADAVNLPCYTLFEIENEVSLPTAFKQCLTLLKE